jgi:hypothetical protein
MPGLLRGVARVAVASGTATAVSNRVSRRQGERWAQQEAPEQAPAGPAPAAGGGADPIARLKELAQLRDQGILTEEEFATQKARVLNG